MFKDDNSPLTNADVESNEIIVNYLNSSDIPILSEEEKHVSYEIRSKWNRFWLVDPIDGTKEFIKRNGEFTVNIALIENNSPILGVIFAPVINQLYFSSEKIGSFKCDTSNLTLFSFENILKNSKSLPIKKNKNIYRVVASRSHLSSETQDYINDLKTIHKKIDFISREVH